METSDKTARELYEDVKANRSRQRFGFGRKPALVNVDLQKAYTRSASSSPPTRPTRGRSTT